MNEFNNRITAQRTILRSVNQGNFSEDIFGLSNKAIMRWMLNNKLCDTAEIVLLVKAVAQKLFFLANKSQEQITNEYNVLTNELDKINQSIKFEIIKLKRI